MPKRKVINLHDLLIEELKDLYGAEAQLQKALPKMAKAADDDDLIAAFERHLEETVDHSERLECVFELLGVPARKKHSDVMKGLISEGEHVIDENAEPVVRDAALIVAAQKVEHYEIAGYGSVRTLAELLGYTDVAKLLQITLDEEGAVGKHLRELASSLNIQAQAPVRA